MADDLISVPDCLMKKLKCLICKGYLCYEPINSLSDGSGVCGKCLTYVDNNTLHREFVLETFLKKITFPCSFKQFGCRASLQFGKVDDHKAVCIYQRCTCPLSSITKPCLWKGATFQMKDHVNSVHSELVLKNYANIKIYINQVCEEKVLIMIEEALFVVKYFYCCSTKFLTYRVAYIGLENNITKAFYQIELMNNSDTDYKIHMKKIECDVYNDGTFKQFSKKINLEEAQSFLENPKIISVVMNFTVELSTESIDYNLLNSIRCYKCFDYLIYPIYTYDAKFYCSSCSKTDKKLIAAENTTIDHLINKANYPCCWRKCKFIGKSTNIKTHEEICSFRMYKCPVDNCKSFYMFSEARNHLVKCHNTNCKELELTFNINISENSNSPYLYTFRDETLFCFKYYIDSGSFVGFLQVQGLLKANTSIDFEHDHCKLKSKPFILNDNEEIKVSMEHLPQCFELSSTLTVTMCLSIYIE